MLRPKQRLERLSGAVVTARIQGRAMGLLSVHLVGVKEVNETYGHDAGDALIRSEPLGLADDYTLVNGRISLGSSDGTWDVSVWGKNLTNEEYLEQSFIVGFFGITGDLYNTPRTYGATLSYNF